MDGDTSEHRSNLKSQFGKTKAVKSVTWQSEDKIPLSTEEISVREQKVVVEIEELDRSTVVQKPIEEQLHVAIEPSKCFFKN